MASVVTASLSSVLSNSNMVTNASISTSSSIVAALNDSSSTTYVTKAASATSGNVQFNIGYPAVPASLIYWRGRNKAVITQPSNAVGGISLLQNANGFGDNISGSYTAGAVASVANYTSADRYLYQYAAASGASTTQAGPNRQYIYDLSFSSSVSTTYYKVWAEIDLTTYPTNTLVSIDGDAASPYAVQNTTNPAIVWSYSQADAIPQDRYAVAIHSASTASPGTGATVVASVSGFGADTTWTSTAALVNASTYYIYIRNAFSLSGLPFWSPWTAVTASVNLAPPPTPSVSTVWTTATQSASVTATGGNFASGTQLFTIQRSDDGGTTYADVRNGVGLTPSASPNFKASVIDYEAPRRTTGNLVRYRAKSVGTVGTATFTSPDGTSASVSTPTDSQHWLKDPTSASLNYPVRLAVNPEVVVEEQTNVLRPLGRTDAVVVSGAIGGEDGSFIIYATTGAEWTAVQTLITTQRTLLLQDVFGEQKYIRIISRGWTKVGTPTKSDYEITCGYVEVSAP